MPSPDPTARIEAEIRGNVSGQVAVGSHILQIGSVHGGVVNVAVPGERPVPRPRPAPVLLRPRPFAGLVGRTAEVESAAAALGEGRPVELSGRPGAGKTTLLRHLAHHPVAGSFPGGVAFLPALRHSADDLLQGLFEALFQADAPLKPGYPELCHLLQGWRALVVLDDVELGREDVERVLNAAPGCTFLWSAPERRGWGEVRALPLAGLAAEEARALLERELERPLDEAERAELPALCRATGGYPLALLQAAARAREDGAPLRAAAADAAAELPEPARRLLGLLGALGGALLHPQDAAVLAELPGAGAELERLERRGLVDRQGERYRVPEPPREAGDGPWRERALAYFAAWAEQRWSAPAEIAAEGDVLLLLLERAADAGAWPEVLRLGRRVEGALALAGRWDAWRRVLELLRRAAEAGEDRRGEAWALHQLGTLALCAGAAAAARSALAQALRLRESLGDREGARVTRHNLELVAGPPPGRETREDGGWRRARKPLAAAGAVAALGVVAVLSISGLRPGPAVERVDAGPVSEGFGERPVEDPVREDPVADPVVEPEADPEPGPPPPPPPPPARARPDPGAVGFGALPVGGAGREARVRLSNEGGSPLRVGRVRLEGGGRDFRLAGDGCGGAVLEPGGRCSVALGFVPSAAGPRAAALVLEHDAEGSPVRVALRGTGEAPPAPAADAALAPREGLDFGEHEVGAPPTVRRATLSSRGGAPLQVRAASVAGAAAGDFSARSLCGREVAPRDDCVIEVSFAPSAAGARDAELVVHTSDPSGPRRVPLEGAGRERALPAGAAASPGRIDFGERPVGPARDFQGAVETLAAGRLVTVRSTGAAPLQVRAVRIEGEHAGDFRVGRGPCREPVPPRERCRFRVDFEPGAPGRRRAAVVIEDNTAASPQRVELSGVGVEPRDTEAPPAPRPLRVGSPDPQRPGEQCRRSTLTWTAVSDPSGPVTYRVTFEAGPTGGGAPTQSVSDAAGTAITVPGPPAGNTLRWNVRARDAAGNEGPPSGWMYVVCPGPVIQ